MSFRFSVLILAGLLTAHAVAAAPASGDAASEAAYEKSFMASLHPKTGVFAIPEAAAQLQLGDNYYFLGKADARRVLVEAWHNPPNQAEGVLGLVVPKGSTVFDEWGAVVTYSKTDYVADGDADKTDYNKMMKDIQDAEPEENRQRQKDGYDPIHTIGWAQPPSYDHAAHTMIWASDLKVGDFPADTLNYDVRLLGRHGVLSLNMISSMRNLPDIREQAKRLALSGHFQAGSRYEDYRFGDPKAAYGVAGLVAAGLGLAVAKKLGILAILLVFLKKGAVFLLAGLAAVGRWLSGVFGSKKKPKVARTPVLWEDAPPPNAVGDELSRVAEPQSQTDEAAPSGGVSLDKD
ncbi:MAG: DUF2167 domain-containing protein [Asticcacaulis sp.]|nr:DUF2167 domain-containing protein [Asticcacaulis sp.]